MKVELQKNPLSQRRSKMKIHNTIFSVVGIVTFLGLVISLSALHPNSVRAQEPYYKGKVIEIIVPQAPGGGTDIFARYISGWLTKFIAGNPTVMVRNMPGANTLIGANYVYKIAKKDGLTLLAGSGAVNMNSLLQLKGCEFDLNKMPMILSGPSVIIQFIKPDQMSDFKDIFNKEVMIFGSQPPGSGHSTTFILVKELLKFKTKKIILAYAGGGESRRAFLAGEINATGDDILSYTSQILPLEKSGEIKYLWQTGTIDEKGNVVRVDPPLGHIPTVYDRYVEIYGNPPSGIIWEALKVTIGAVAVFNKSLTFPPGTPSGIVDIASDACEKIAKNPQFIADADTKLKCTFMAGNQMKRIYEKIMLQANTEAISWLRTFLREKWGVE